ncbi:hypothetical protein B0T21DRAFT_130085 [Apiosordaria backusii]|uniref:Secreted protein n=1 Tax=Apiosordaria backusii TaxID=314023 RepID=A0AA40K1H4_9PEZI|nr:hypothetical protein B0T21DRAFT_130085 [Apiosordaria backusii]
MILRRVCVCLFNLILGSSANTQRPGEIRIPKYGNCLDNHHNLSTAQQAPVRDHHACVSRTHAAQLCPKRVSLSFESHLFANLPQFLSRAFHRFIAF